MTERSDLLQGTLDLLILKSLTLGVLHGWAISKRLRELSSDALDVGQGSLYPALYRLEDRGWIASEKGTAENGRQVRFYRLTSLGRKQLMKERSKWHAFAAAVNQVLAANS